MIVSVTLKGFEPARLRDRVIVEKDKIFTRGYRGAIVAAFGEAVTGCVTNRTLSPSRRASGVSRQSRHRPRRHFDIVSDCPQHSFQALASQ
jgi:hypothetical protein